MNNMVFCKGSFRKIGLWVAGLLVIIQLNAQNNPDSLRIKYLYRPQESEQKDTVYRCDSMLIREQFIRDSIAARLQFIQDSIIAREKFVRDSIARRQRIMDSLTFLKTELPVLFDATVKTITEQLVIHNSGIGIAGDSMLTDYTYEIVPFGLSQPFTPWKSTINLSTNPVTITVNNTRKKIKGIKAPFFNCTYEKRPGMLVIREQGIIVNNHSGNFYKDPVDTVFYDKTGRILKIKRYAHFYQVTGNYQKGASLFVHLTQVRQFEYGSANVPAMFQEVNFCERWSSAGESKVCNIITYEISRQGNTYTLIKQNNPANGYSDGTYVVEYNSVFDPVSQSFENKSKTESWKCFVELNEAGNVSRYVYQKKGVVNETLLVNYFLDDPSAKHKVETITCFFEPDGISYRQVNNTTGQRRDRDKLTMEWSPWR